MPWTVQDIPVLTGKTILITGANSGLGYEAALALAGKGAHVILGCRDEGKARAAERQIRAQHPHASTSVLALDLASLAEVRRAADAVRAAHPRLDVLMNNAGVMALPRCRTADGFEMQFGTNHLGHFALTGLLVERLCATPGARVVTVSSTAHRISRVRFEDLHGEHRYRKWLAYGQSKLANLLFAYELQRRLAQAGAEAISVAAHPGYAGTNLQLASARMAGSGLMERFWAAGNALVAQSAAKGALPQIYAAVAPGVRGGQYFGPDGLAELWGYPKEVTSIGRSHDRAAATRLWVLSEQMTGVRYDALHRG
ncbi:MAG: oxidoreductase [Candidatus Binatia bacterium]